jgi:hypothetical protein
MRNFLYIIIGAMLFLTACGSSKQVVVVQPKAQPSWYTHPPLSNENELYALGEGKEKQEAISNALAQLLSTLSVEISSKYSAKTVVKEGTYHNSSDATYINETQSEVKKIRVSNYELLASQKLGFKHYAVLVKVDKVKFFESLKKELTQQFKLIETQQKSLAGKNELQQLSFYKKALASLDDLQNRLAVMSVLQPHFNPDPFVSKYEKLRKGHDALLRSISFWVGANYSPLAAPIAKGLSSQKMTIKKKKSQSRFRVYVAADIQKANAYGFTLARANITIKTKDIRGNIIASNALNLVGQSSQGYSIAKQDLVRKLNRLIEKEGIAKVLNLDI